MFAALKTHVNATVFSKLADAVAVIDSVDIDVIFDDDYDIGEAGFSGFSASSPAIHCLSSDVVSVSVDQEIVVNSVNYKVASIEPDNDGVTTLILKNS